MKYTVIAEDVEHAKAFKPELYEAEGPYCDPRRYAITSASPAIHVAEHWDLAKARDDLEQLMAEDRHDQERIRKHVDATIEAYRAAGAFDRPRWLRWFRSAR